MAGNANIDETVLNIARLLLRANEHAFDFVIRYRGVIGTSADFHVIAGPAEQIDGGLLQAAVRNGKPQSSRLTQSEESISAPDRKFPVGILRAAFRNEKFRHKRKIGPQLFDEFGVRGQDQFFVNLFRMPGIDNLHFELAAGQKVLG